MSVPSYPAGTRYIPNNIAVMNQKYAGEANASNAKYFDPIVPHSMPIDTVHTLGAEQILNGTFDTDLTSWVNYGTGTLAWDADNGGSAKLTVAAANDGIRQNGVFLVGLNYVEIQVKSSALRTLQYFNGAAWLNFPQQPSVTGAYETLVGEVTVTTTTNFIIRVSNSVAADIFYFDNVTSKNLSLPTASYIQYLAYPSLTWKQLSSTVDYGYGLIPVSITWPLTESFQVAINSTAPLEAADILELNADQDLMFKVLFDGYVLSSGYSAANIVGFLDGTAGTSSGAYVQDINVALGTENVNPAGVQLFGTGNTSALNATLDGYDIHVETADVSYRPIVQFTRDDASITKLNLVTLTVSCSVGLAKLSSFEALSTYTINQEISAGQTFTYTFIDYMKAATSNYRATFDSASYTLYDIEVKASIKEVSAKEIANFTSNVNTTYLNGTTGATNLKLVKDAIGRTTGTAAEGTISHTSDGYVDTKFLPNLSIYTIEETVTGNLAILDALGVPTGAFSVRTETRRLIHEEGVGDSLYIDTVLQPYTPSLPNPLVSIKLGNTAVIGYADTITNRSSKFIAKAIVSVP